MREDEATGTGRIGESNKKGVKPRDNKAQGEALEMGTHPNIRGLKARDKNRRVGEMG